MPPPEKYRRQQMEHHASAEREGRWDGVLALVRAVAEIVLWTTLGAALIFLAFYVSDVGLGRILWLLGCIVWIGGVTSACLGAYVRGEDRGLW
jgi:hypothetical protein